MAGSLYCGDNLGVLKKDIQSESVDLVYLDPPFNSGRNYEQEGGQGDKRAFNDVWWWNEEREGELQDLRENHKELGRFLKFLVDSMGKNNLSAYLVMMTARLVELHRVLKPTGSLYLHCDPTASHYLKVILDQIFGLRNFRNEITWKRTSSHGGARRWARVHDTILFYTKTDKYTWNQTFEPPSKDYVKKFYRHKDDRGIYRTVNLTGPRTLAGPSGQPWRDIDPSRSNRHWAIPNPDALPEWLSLPPNWEELSPQERLDLLDAAGLIHWPKKKGGIPEYKRYLETYRGTPIRDVITDIPPLSNQSKERLGYPTQKPVALLKRIIQASSNPGDVVLDPFCGSGTTLVAAEELGRMWIGIDSSPEAIALTEARLKRIFGLDPAKTSHGEDLKIYFGL